MRKLSLVWMYTSPVTIEVSMKVYQKPQMERVYNLTVPLLGMYLKDSK